MDKQLTARIAGIVASHKDYMTCNEMAEEFDIPAPDIRYYCRKAGIELLGVKAHNINYIRDMAGKKPVEWIAAKLGVNVSYINLVAGEANISLAYIPREVIEPVKQAGINRGRWSRSLILAELNEHIDERIEAEMPRTHTIKTELTQGPSPFGLADEVVGRRFK